MPDWHGAVGKSDLPDTQSAYFDSHADWVLVSVLPLISNEIQKTFSFMFQRKSLKVAPKSSSVLVK